MNAVVKLRPGSTCSRDHQLQPDRAVATVGPVAKVLFNNKGVAAKETDNCANYPPDDNPCGTGESGLRVSRK
jgi:hypothetical protein